jgi:hypothetical protein
VPGRGEAAERDGRIRVGKTGYTVKVLTADFSTDLTVDEFETFALWTVQDEPPPGS